MSLPYDGSYFTFQLDPVASLRDIEDEEAIESARTISPKVYVGCTLEVGAYTLLRFRRLTSLQSVGAPQLPPAYGTAYIALVQQGLPPDKSEEFFGSRMCVPI